MTAAISQDASPLNAQATAGLSSLASSSERAQQELAQELFPAILNALGEQTHGMRLPEIDIHSIAKQVAAERVTADSEYTSMLKTAKALVAATHGQASTPLAASLRSSSATLVKAFVKDFLSAVSDCALATPHGAKAYLDDVLASVSDSHDEAQVRSGLDALEVSLHRIEQFLGAEAELCEELTDRIPSSLPVSLAPLLQAAVADAAHAAVVQAYGAERERLQEQLLQLRSAAQNLEEMLSQVPEALQRYPSTHEESCLIIEGLSALELRSRLASRLGVSARELPGALAARLEQALRETVGLNSAPLGEVLRSSSAYQVARELLRVIASASGEQLIFEALAGSGADLFEVAASLWSAALPTSLPSDLAVPQTGFAPARTNLLHLPAGGGQYDELRASLILAVKDVASRDGGVTVIEAPPASPVRCERYIAGFSPAFAMRNEVLLDAYSLAVERHGHQPALFGSYPGHPQALAHPSISGANPEPQSEEKPQ